MILRKSIKKIKSSPGRIEGYCFRATSFGNHGQASWGKGFTMKCRSKIINFVFLLTEEPVVVNLIEDIVSLLGEDGMRTF